MNIMLGVERWGLCCLPNRFFWTCCILHFVGCRRMGLFLWSFFPPLYFLYGHIEFLEIKCLPVEREI